MIERPSTETLLKLTLDELTEEEASEVREHLIDCPESRETVRALLEEPEGPPALEEPISREEKAEAWQLLSQRIQAQQVASASEGKTDATGVSSIQGNPQTQSQESGPPAGEGSKVLPYSKPATLTTGSGPRIVGTAAAAAIFAFGVGLFVGQGPEPVSTRVGAWTTLEGDQMASRGEVDLLPQVTCPLSEGDFIWSLSLPVGISATSGFYLEVQRPDGKSEGGVLAHQDDFGQILITRPQSQTPDGEYLIRVWDSNRAELLETLRFSVSCDEDPDSK